MFEEATYKRCACKEPVLGEDGTPVLDASGKPKLRQLGAACPKLEARGHGNWYFYLEFPATTGKERDRVRRGGYRTQKAAAAEAKKEVDLREAGIKGGKLTVAQFMASWLLGKADIARSTVNGYERHIRLYIGPLLGHLQMIDLDPDHIRAMFTSIDEENDRRMIHAAFVDLLVEECEAARAAWRAHPSRKPGEGRQAWQESRDSLRDAWHQARTRLAEERKKKQRITDIPTQHRIKATLSSALEDAVKELKISRNWAALVTLTPAKRPKPLVWTPSRVEEWRRTGVRPGPVMVWTPELTGQFLDSAMEDRLYPLWHLFAFRGPRRGEGCALPWTEVDFENHSFNITQQMVTIAHQVYKEDPKADSVRTVKMDSGTEGLLKMQKERQAKERSAAGPAWVETGLVFTQEDGTAYHPDYLTYRFAVLIERAGLPPIRLHDLRHIAATLSRAAGVDMKGVQVMLGHSCMQITADTYTSVLPQLEQAEAEAVLNVVPRAGQEKPAPKAVKSPTAAAIREAQRAARRKKTPVGVGR
jgi:integrase